MSDQVPVLLGTAGMVDGEFFILEPGTDIVVGRSRSCDVSLRRTTAYLKTPPAQRDNDHDFNTVSRRHLKITISKSLANIQDLSTNGTFFNGEPMREPHKVDLAAGPCTVRLGTRESFQLLLMPKDDPRLKNAQVVTHNSGKDLSDSLATE
jgi:pSer/pThr/pTyr-binding forkhead associated (FHA) protein